MIHKNAIEALNTSLQFIRNDQSFMGGVTVVFAGNIC